MSEELKTLPIKQKTEEEIAIVRPVLENILGLSATIRTAAESRQQIRDAFAMMVCPWPVGAILYRPSEKEEGRQVVVTAMRGGLVDGEFYRLWGRPLTKAGKLGTRLQRIDVLKYDWVWSDVMYADPPVEELPAEDLIA